MRTLKDVRQAYKEATDLLPTLTRDAAAFAAKEAEITALEGEMDVFEREARAIDIRNRSLALASLGDNVDINSNVDVVANTAGNWRSARDMVAQRRVGPVAPAVRFAELLDDGRRSWGVQFEPAKHFRSLGEQLQAIATYYLRKDGTVDSRLNRAPTGASEIDPTGGGFLVQTDFAAAIWMLAHEMGDVLGAVNGIPIAANANGIKIRGIDETSRATGSRWGGVQSYWVGEGTSVTPSKPKFRLVEFDLKKLMSVMYTTDELMQDASALSSIAGQAFSEEVTFMTEDAIFNGSGAGQPLGFLNSPALVSVAKQPGQAAATVVKENIDAMWSRCWLRSRKNAAWYINQDVEPQLHQMGQIVGTAGLPVYVPAGGLSAAPYATLYGRPVVLTEYNAALGTPGDIVLADLSQYTKVDKGGVQAANSMHVAFLTDESVFRITYRVDGKPMWSQPLTPYKGSLTKSPFVAIAAR